MADPTTILDYATLRRDQAKQAVTTAKQELASAQVRIAKRNDDISKATGAISDLEKSAADIRKRLSEVSTPADGSALLASLEQIIIRLRTKRAAILKAQAELSYAKADADTAQTELASTTSVLASAESDVTQSKKSDKQRKDMKAALAAATLSKINTVASKTLDVTLPEGASFKKAKERIESDIPAKLLTRARNRRENAAATINRSAADTLGAEDALLKERNDNGGLEGQMEKVSVDFLRSENAVRDFAGDARSTFDQAVSLLSQVGDPAKSPLTQEQSDRINDASLKSAREAAIKDEKDRDVEWEKVVSKRGALEAKILKALAANKNPDDVTEVQTAKDALIADEASFKAIDDAWRAKDKARDDKLVNVETKQAELAKAIRDSVAAKKNPDTDPNVSAARLALTGAVNSLKTANDDYKASNHGILHAWEAAIPDTTWRLLDDFERASALLNTLKDSDPAALSTALDLSEVEYVKAQLKTAASVNVLSRLSAKHAVRAAANESARQAGAARLVSALRGDN